MKIGSIGYNYSHEDDFVMDRPSGPGCWLLLLIKNPAHFVVNGTDYSVKANSFVIISAETPCKYYAVGKTYADDWLYSQVDRGDDEMLAGLGIPTDTPIHLGNIEDLSQIMHIMTYELYSADDYHDEICRKYFEIMLLKIS